MILEISMTIYIESSIQDCQRNNRTFYSTTGLLDFQFKTMTLSQFLANCKYPDYQNEFAIVRQPKEYLPNNITIFQTENELVNTISSQIASTIFDRDTIISDIPNYTGIWDEDLMDKSQNFPYIIPHVTLSDIGIDSFALCQNDNSVIACYYRYLTKLEQSIIDIAIWNVCADKIIENLSKLTVFKLSKSQFSMFGLQSIIADMTFNQVNNPTQLRMYILEHHLDDLSLIKGSLVKNYLTVPKENVNPDIAWNKMAITLNITLDKYEIDPYYSVPAADYDMYYQVVPVTFQIIKNLDLSISLVPDSKEILKLIEKQIKFLEKGFAYIENRGYLVPNTIVPLFEYLNNNEIRTCYGKVKRICNYEETLKAAKDQDRKNYDSCYFGNFELRTPPSYEETYEFIVKMCEKLLIIFE